MYFVGLVAEGILEDDASPLLAVARKVKCAKTAKATSKANQGPMTKKNCSTADAFTTYHAEFNSDDMKSWVKDHVTKPI